MSSLLLFGSSFIVVLLLGLQTHFVKDKLKGASFITSIMIGVSQLFVLKGVPNANLIESTFFVLGGACGIVVSIMLHDLWLRYFPVKGSENV